MRDKRERQHRPADNVGCIVVGKVLQVQAAARKIKMKKRS
jgi:hypothetical protein